MSATPRLTYQPKPYQGLITNFILEHPRCSIWVPMGFGKTVSTATALDFLKLAGETDPVLVLAPLRVASGTWPDEFRKWEHLKDMRCVAITGKESDRRAALQCKADVYTINYENVPWLVEYWGDRWPYRTVIADESTKLKGLRLKQGAARAGALRAVAHSHVKRWINLTGTPAGNGLADLWGQTWLVDAGQRLGKSYTAFSQRWFTTGYDGSSMEAQPHAQAQIHAALEDCTMALKVEDWFDIDAPIVSNIYVDLPVSAQVLYRKMEKEMFAEIEASGVTALTAATKTMKLLQFSSGSVYLDPLTESDEGKPKEWKAVHEEKLLALDDIVEEAAGMPLLVAYEFKSDLARILKRYPKARQLDNNPQTIKDWNAGKIPMLVIHPASAGHGLNLQWGSNILVFYGQNWSLELRLQTLERIGPVRQKQAGLDRPVFIYNILARGTVDELVMERVETKKSVQDILLEAMKRRK